MCPEFTLVEAAKAETVQAILSTASDSMTFRLRIVMAVLPVIFMGIGYYVLSRKYKIDEDKYNEILAEIKARKGE